MLSMCRMWWSNLTLFLSPRPLLSLLVSNQLHPLHLSHLPLSQNHGSQKEMSMRFPHYLNPPHPHIFHHPHTLYHLHSLHHPHILQHPHTLQHPHILHHPHSLMMNMSGLKSHFRYQCSVVHVSGVRVCICVCMFVCLCRSMLSQTTKIEAETKQNRSHLMRRNHIWLSDINCVACAGLIPRPHRMESGHCWLVCSLYTAADDLRAFVCYLIGRSTTASVAYLCSFNQRYHHLKLARCQASVCTYTLVFSVVIGCRLSGNHGDM